MTFLTNPIYKGRNILIMCKQYLLFVLFVIPFFLFAQKKKKDLYDIQHISGIIIDANIDDWENKLYNLKSDVWSYAVASDKTKIYAAVIIKDKKLMDEAIRNGILFNISYSDKKMDGARIIYPKFNLEKLENSIADDPEEGRTIVQEELLQSTKGYYVAGFDKVRDGLLARNNQYGIKALCKIDESGSLVYECEIPLHLIKFKTSTIVAQLAVNTLYFSRQKMSAGMRSSGYHTRGISKPTLKNPYTENTDVWFSGIIK